MVRPFFNHLYYVLKRHFFNQILTKKLGKALHYSKNIFQNKFMGYPRLAIIETGNICNLQCPTCPTPHHYLDRPSTLMSFENFKYIIDQIKDYVHIVLLYNTNEPLLNPALPEMIQYAHQQNLYTMISTNLTLLDERKTREILNSELDEILLCLDGMSKKSYEAFRIGANFETVMKNIKHFCAEKQRRKLIKPYIELQFIVTKLNQKEIPLVKKFAKELGVDRLRIKSLAIVEYAYPEPIRSRLMEKFLPTAKDVKIRYRRNKEKKYIKRSFSNCKNAKNQISILVDGRLVMCCYDLKGEYVYGNIFENSFSEIWFSPQALKKRRLAEKREYPLCKQCESC